MQKYSKAEMQLAEYFGYSDLLPTIEPIVLYRIMMEKAFIKNMSGTAVESLRRCMNAFTNNSPNRLTHEWDELIIV